MHQSTQLKKYTTRKFFMNLNQILTDFVSKLNFLTTFQSRSLAITGATTSLELSSTKSLGADVEAIHWTAVTATTNCLVVEEGIL